MFSLPLDLVTLIQHINMGKIRFAGITNDSRAVEQNGVFVAIQGRRMDGHAYISDAIHRGAVLIVAEKEPDSEIPGNVAYITVADSRRALATLSAAVHGYPADKLFLSGVTGSNGKTTVAHMIDSIYQQALIPSGLIGTVFNRIGHSTIRSTLTTPEACDIHRMLRQLVDIGARAAVMEVSAQGFAMGRVTHIPFDVAVFTNLTVDHLDFHASMEEYADTKYQFFRTLPASCVRIVNADDPFSERIRRLNPGSTYTISRAIYDADIYAYDVRSASSGVCFKVQYSTRIQRLTSGALPTSLEVPVPGIHNVENALCAIAASIAGNIPGHAIAAGLQSFQPAERRMEVRYINGVQVVDDTAMNPGSIHAVLQTFPPEEHASSTVLFAIRGNRSEELNRENAIAIADWYYEHRNSSSLRLVVTSSVDVTGEHDTVSDGERIAFLEELDRRNIPYTYYPRLMECIEHAWQGTEPGDLLFLLGAQGMDPGRILLQDAVHRTMQSTMQSNQTTVVV